MVETAIVEFERVGVAETPGVVLADAGYWKNDAIEALLSNGIPTLVAPDAAQTNRGPDAAAVVTTSPAASWRPTGARSSTCAAKASSNRSSAR